MDVLDKRRWKIPFFTSTKRKVSAAVGDTPDGYLKLAIKCMKHAQKLNSLKFNNEQSIYLANRLETAVQSANSFLERVKSRANDMLSSPPETAKVLELLNLLFALAKEVECFIECCCKDVWLQAATLLTNVSEHVLSLGFNLKLCILAFAEGASASQADVASLFQAEVEIVKGKASVDEENLWIKLIALLQSGRLNGEEHELVTFLLDRSRSIQTPDSQASSQRNFYERDLTKLNVMGSLGKGASATVHKATWLGVEVAMKTFDGPDSADFKKEVSILVGLCHPNVISLLCYGVDHADCSIVMELMDEDLHSFMKKRRKLFRRQRSLISLITSDGNDGDKPLFSILEGVRMMLQIANAMEYLHRMKIVHRDLKSHNILVKCVSGTELGVRSVQVKVADFGLARTKETSLTNSYQKQKAGTSRWMAPEVIECGKVGNKVEDPFKSDVYSFGMVCYEVLTGNVPFFTMAPAEANRKVVGGVRPPLPGQCPLVLRILIEKCWSPEPSMRPCFGDICAELRHIQCALLFTCVTSSQEAHSGESGAYNQANIPFAPNQCIQRGKPGGAVLEFTVAELKTITDNFSEQHKIGQGGFGMVYRGRLRDGRMVAIKRGKKDAYEQRLMVEFRAEVEMLSQVDHLNLGKLIGYTEEGNERILVVEYVPNGNLGEHLDGTYGKVLDMSTRLDIAIDVAHALTYLHLYADRPIIHGDVKSSNILLTDTYRAKVADFGFSCVGPSTDDVATHVSTQVKGTAGYLDPEYLNTLELNTKSDVYSFGILLVEIFTGRRPIELKSPSDERLTVRWAFRKFVEGNVSDILDPKLEKTPAALSIIERVAELAFACSAPTKGDRPSMKKAAEGLWEIWKDYLVEHQSEVKVKAERSESIRIESARSEMSADAQAGLHQTSNRRRPWYTHFLYSFG